MARHVFHVKGFRSGLTLTGSGSRKKTDPTPGSRLLSDENFSKFNDDFQSETIDFHFLSVLSHNFDKVILIRLLDLR